MPFAGGVAQPMGIPRLFNVAKTEKRLGIALWNIEHVMRLAETRAACAQLAHESLTFGDPDAEMARPRRGIEMVQIIGLDACLHERPHQGFQRGPIVIDTLQKH